MGDKIPAGHLEYLYPEPLIKIDYDLCLVLINETGTNINLDDNNANNIATCRDVNKVIDDEETNSQNTLLINQHAKCVTEIAETRFKRAEAILAKLKEATKGHIPQGDGGPPQVETRENPSPERDSQYSRLKKSYTPAGGRGFLSK